MSRRTLFTNRPRQKNKMLAHCQQKPPKCLDRYTTRGRTTQHRENFRNLRPGERRNVFCVHVRTTALKPHAASLLVLIHRCGVTVFTVGPVQNSSTLDVSRSKLIYQHLNATLFESKFLICKTREFSARRTNSNS